MAGESALAVGNCAKTILVVDDEEVMRSLVGEVLDENGFVVLEASSVDQAIEVLGQNPVDIVLTDFTLPRRNGLSLACHIRDSGMSAPVVLMTGNSARELQDQATASGVCAIVQKPFHEDDLVKTLMDALGL
ncbi:MAG: response regulator [Bdellovibrionaceae bacterium]|nr:response regulator [Bdellovibrionales bacterium]MCB9082861.1 response regulator [Pseudobdellovibrionaceae bacterium]